MQGYDASVKTSLGLGMGSVRDCLHSVLCQGAPEGNQLSPLAPSLLHILYEPHESIQAIRDSASLLLKLIRKGLSQLPNITN